MPYYVYINHDVIEFELLQGIGIAQNQRLATCVHLMLTIRFDTHRSIILPFALCCSWRCLDGSRVR